MFIDMNEADAIKVTVLIENSAHFDSQLVSKHGIAFLLEVTSNVHRKILIDTGSDAESLLKNMQLLKIDPREIDIIFLTHCHNDHVGGLVGLLKAIDKEIPIIAHRDILRRSIAFDPYFKYVGIPCKKEDIISNKGNLILIDEPFKIIDGVLSTGQVERITDYEDTGVNHFNLIDGKVFKDDLLDDMSIIINMKNKGLFILTGCSHAGLINIIKHAIKITGINNVYGILGGFHLVSASDDRIEKTIKELKKLDLALIGGGHCTGFYAQTNLFSEFGNTFIPLHAGLVLELE